MLDQTVMDNPHVKIGELSSEELEQFRKALKAAYYIRPRAEGEPRFEFSLPTDQEVIVAAATSQGDGASIAMAMTAFLAGTRMGKDTTMALTICQIVGQKAMGYRRDNSLDTWLSTPNAGSRRSCLCVVLMV